VAHSPIGLQRDDPPIPAVPAAYQGQGSSLKSPSGSLRPGAAPYGDAAGLRSPALASPGYAGGGQFNNPRSPGPGGYSVSRNASGAGYIPAVAPNASTEYFAPQPRSNTQGSWNSAIAEDMGRSGSSNSQRPRGNGGYGGGHGGAF
jgi:hypothetical protein